MITSESIKEISAAMSAFLGKVENTSKDKTGYGYKYSDLGQLLSICRPLLSEYKLALFQGVERSNLEQDYVCVHTLLSHVSGEWVKTELSVPVFAGKGMNAAQAMGSVCTYARRYALASILGIAQEDDDGASGGKQPATTFITANEADHIKAMAIKADIDMSIICNAMGITDIDKLPSHKYQVVINKIEAKMKAENNAVNT